MDRTEFKKQVTEIMEQTNFIKTSWLEGGQELYIYNEDGEQIGYIGGVTFTNIKDMLSIQRKMREESYNTTPSDPKQFDNGIYL